MAQINRQIGQERANISAGFIPLSEPVDGECMAERMQSGSPLSWAWIDAKTERETAERGAKGMKFKLSGSVAKIH
jgi:hypothetical protein